MVHGSQQKINQMYILDVYIETQKSYKELNLNALLFDKTNIQDPAIQIHNSNENTKNKQLNVRNQSKEETEMKLEEESREMK